MRGTWCLIPSVVAAQRMKLPNGWRNWVGSELLDCSLIRARFQQHFPGLPEEPASTVARFFANASPELLIQSCQESSKSSTRMEPANGFSGSASHHSLKKSKRSSQISLYT